MDRRKGSPGADKLASAFEQSARRWELIVYPSLFAFIILAAYGFYLVFSLAKDVHFLAISVDHNMSIVASNMQTMADSVTMLSSDVRVMSDNLKSIDGNVTLLQPMTDNMTNMTLSINQMTHATSQMSQDVNTIKRPMGMFNSFMPW